MTHAVCFKCGETKWGAFNDCEQCHAIPKTDDELMLSLAFTDHYFERDKLQQIGREIKAGRTPQLADAWKEQLAPAIQEAKRILGLSNVVAKKKSMLSRSPLNMLRSKRVAVIFSLLVVLGLAAGASYTFSHKPKRSSLTIAERFSLATTFYRSNDYDLAIGVIRPVADTGDVNAQINLANATRALKSRLSLRRDDPSEKPEEYRADDYLKYLCLAALQNDGEAQNMMGFVVINSNEAEAVFWWRHAAERSDPGALYEMASILHFGEYGVQKDDRKALRMLREAAELGNDLAQMHLADIYWDGKGNSDPPWTTLGQDYEEAAKWYLYQSAEAVTLGGIPKSEEG